MENLFIFLCLQIVAILSQKYLLKMRGDVVFIYQNIIIHYKYLHNNIHAFVEFLDQSIYVFFCPAPPRPADFHLRPALPRPAPWIFTFAPPRPAPRNKRPPRTSLVQTCQPSSLFLGPQGPLVIPLVSLIHLLNICITIQYKYDWTEAINCPFGIDFP